MTEKEVTDHLFIFQNLLAIILKRRSFFELFETSLKNGGATSDEVRKNDFVTTYITDYTRAQLIDLRKLFENDDQSFKLSSIRKFIADPNLKTEHDALFNEWKTKFDDQTNKAIAHVDKNSGKLPKHVSKNELDAFIDRANAFMDHLVDGLKTKGNVELDSSHRDPKSDYLNKDSERDFKEFIDWAKR